MNHRDIFHVGQRVRLSELGRQHFGSRQHAEGIVTKVGRKWLSVRHWGKVGTAYHPDFWEPMPPDAETEREVAIRTANVADVLFDPMKEAIRRFRDEDARGDNIGAFVTDEELYEAMGDPGSDHDD